MIGLQSRAWLVAVKTAVSYYAVLLHHAEQLNSRIVGKGRLRVVVVRGCISVSSISGFFLPCPER